jgi:hypothetical protein
MIFENIRNRLPPKIWPLFDEGHCVVAGGSVFRDIIGAPNSDIDIFAVTPIGEALLRTELDDYEVLEKEDSDVKSVNYIYVTPQGIRQVIDVVPLRKPWARTTPVATVQAILESFDIGVSMFATNFEVLFVGKNTLQDLAARRIVQTRQRETTGRRLLKYQHLTAWPVIPLNVQRPLAHYLAEPIHYKRDDEFTW